MSFFSVPFRPKKHNNIEKHCIYDYMYNIRIVKVKRVDRYKQLVGRGSSTKSLVLTTVQVPSSCHSASSQHKNEIREFTATDRSCQRGTLTSLLRFCWSIVVDCCVLFVLVRIRSWNRWRNHWLVIRRGILSCVRSWSN